MEGNQTNLMSNKGLTTGVVMGMSGLVSKPVGPTMTNTLISNRMNLQMQMKTKKRDSLGSHQPSSSKVTQLQNTKDSGA